MLSATLAPGTYTLTITSEGIQRLREARHCHRPWPTAGGERAIVRGYGKATDHGYGRDHQGQRQPLGKRQLRWSSKARIWKRSPTTPMSCNRSLEALAGPSAGPNGGQIYIDGFTGGQLPSKSSIREIRVNQNPFSAQYDSLGYGRIEILTKPGTDKLHGQLFAERQRLGFQHAESLRHKYSRLSLGDV